MKYGTCTTVSQYVLHMSVTMTIYKVYSPIDQKIFHLALVTKSNPMEMSYQNDGRIS